jgi:hypothetical protein
MTNNFTYRHSELPPVRPEIQAEIVALDCYIADLILKSQGNYRELKQLGEVLDSLLDTCDLNLQSIRIIADDAQKPPDISMKDLPFEEKLLIYSCNRTNSILLNLLSALTGQSPKILAEEIASQAAIHQTKPTEAEIETFVDGLVPWVKKANAKGSSTNYLYREQL